MQALGNEIIRIREFLETVANLLDHFGCVGSRAFPSKMGDCPIGNTD